MKDSKEYGMTCVDPKSLTTDAIENELAGLAAHIYAATYRFLELVRELDERRAWESMGARSCAHFLNYRVGMDLVTAREKVRVARALPAWPKVSASFAKGELSYAKVRELTRSGCPENEETLLAIAHAGTASHVAKLVRRYRRVTNLQAAEQHKARSLDVFFDDDGTMVLRGRLPAEAGARVMKALEMAGLELFGKTSPETTSHPHTPAASGASERRADALVHLAERAFAKMTDADPAAVAASAAAASDDVEHAENTASSDRCQQAEHHTDACNVEGTRRRTATAPAIASRGIELVVHLDATAPMHEPHAVLDNGPALAPSTWQRLSCDAGIVTMRHDADGNVLNVGRKTRVIPAALRRALHTRDQGCRFPGCTSRFIDAHHVQHWADGGETSVQNLLSLCRFHHTLLHEGGASVASRNGVVEFFDSRGQPLPSSIALPPPCSFTPSCAIDAQTLPLWQGDSMDYDFALEGLLR